MKVLLFNGSSHTNGCTYTALNEVAQTLNKENIDTEILQIGGSPVRDCIGCGKCNNCACIFNDDIVNEWINKAADADGFVFGTPVYYAHPSGVILSAMNRMFYAGSANFKNKPAAAVASARRAGTTATLDVMNKYISFANMIAVGSSYWNMVHGQKPDDVKQDLEGLQTMRNLGKNMAWVLKCIDLGYKNGINPPVPEKGCRTNFIR